MPSSFLTVPFSCGNRLFLVFESLAGDRILRPRLLVALQVHLGLGQHVLVALQSALSLVATVPRIGRESISISGSPFWTIWPSR